MKESAGSKDVHEFAAVVAGDFTTTCETDLGVCSFRTVIALSNATTKTKLAATVVRRGNPRWVVLFKSYKLSDALTLFAVANYRSAPSILSLCWPGCSQESAPSPNPCRGGGRFT
jgi:translation initiation factor 2 alpha subunit (eIF-2alpha)